MVARSISFALITILDVDAVPISKVTLPAEPPPVKPAPATTAEISPSLATHEDPL